MLKYLPKYAIPLSIVGTLVGGSVLLKDWIGGNSYDGNEEMFGKTVIITGANTGIGKETAKELARRGARVILACRNNEKCGVAREEIVSDTSNRNVVVKNLDLASLESIRIFADDINKNERHVDVLVNNAGVMRCPKSLTQDGFEMQLGTNHLGHFLLTNLLLEKLKNSAPSRIVNVSSLAHKRGKIKFKDLNSSYSYDAGEAYFQSKVANLLFTVELSKQLEGTGVIVNAVNPGIVKTEIGRHLPVGNSKISSAFLFPITWLFMKTPAQGAQSSIYAAVSKDLDKVTGKYISDCSIVAPSKEATNESDAHRLWMISEKWTRLT